MLKINLEKLAMFFPEQVYGELSIIFVIAKC